MQEQLKQALDFANYKQTFSIQKKVLKEKNDTKHHKDYHRGAVAWDWPPRDKRLLLEPAGFKRCEFVFSALHLLLTDFHLIN
jgi:hypothetical protein